LKPPTIICSGHVLYTKVREVALPSRRYGCLKTTSSRCKSMERHNLKKTLHGIIKTCIFSTYFLIMSVLCFAVRQQMDCDSSFLRHVVTVHQIIRRRIPQVRINNLHRENVRSSRLKSVPWRRRLVTGLLPQGCRFNSWPSRVWFVVDTVALLRVLQYSLLRINPPMSRNYIYLSTTNAI
jgi:hypothetical protein